MEKLYQGFEKTQYSRLATAIHIKTMECLTKLLPLKEPADFYERVLQSLDELTEYFDHVCCVESCSAAPACEEQNTFKQILQRCTMSTETLELDYFQELCKMGSLVNLLHKSKCY